MKYDIELSLPPGADCPNSSIDNLRGNNFSVEVKPNGGFGVRTGKSEVYDGLLGMAVVNFLSEFERLDGFLKSTTATLRVGVFFLVDEIAFLSICLSSFELSWLSKYNLSLDISAYPCSSSEEENSDDLTPENRIS